MGGDKFNQGVVNPVSPIVAFEVSSRARAAKTTASVGKTANAENDQSLRPGF
jgi:hypothetical protein